MANADSIFGLIPVSNNPATTTLTAGGTFAKGDIVMVSSGKAVIFDHGAGSLACGVAATAGSSGDSCIVYTDPETEFRIQCKTGGTYAKATHDLTFVDTDGTTGVMEADLGSSSNNTLLVIGHYPIKGSEDVGEHAVIRVKIAQHLFASTPGATGTNPA